MPGSPPQPAVFPVFRTMSAVASLSSRPSLPQVTLVAVTSVALEATAAALRRSLQQVAFGRALLLSDRQPEGLLAEGIEWRQIAPIRTRAAYSHFILHNLCEHVDTSHTLLVQWDGFVRDGSRWQDVFLNFDYIGAPWPQYFDGMAVGNGGFSLRSRKLLYATRSLAAIDGIEDTAICRTFRSELEQRHDIRFADIDVAMRFSYERGGSNQAEFGFHGVFNMHAELHGERLSTCLANLEPGVIGERESTELLLQGLRRRDLPLIRLALVHHRANPHHARRLLRAAGWLVSGRSGSPFTVK
jgi:hypothetical protein